MDLNEITDFENPSDAAERHDRVMQLASEATSGELRCCVCMRAPKWQPSMVWTGQF